MQCFLCPSTVRAVNRHEIAALDDDALREYVEQLATDHHGTLRVEERNGWFAASVLSPDHPPDVDVGSSEWSGVGFSWREAMELLAVGIKRTA
jgi:hypothetical protein